MPDPTDLLVRETRIRASLLMKSLRVADPAALARVCRFAAAHPKKASPPISGGTVKRRLALEIIVFEFGYASYAALRQALRPDGDAQQIVDTSLFFNKGHSAFWNNWFSTYTDAKHHLMTVGGFLFPYRSQFVVVEADFLISLGIDAMAAEWAAIGHDWVQPADGAAYRRLVNELCALGYRAHSAEVVR